ncbi:MAG: ornithine carbamoyltransferase [Aestuariibacter sp.]
MKRELITLEHWSAHDIYQVLELALALKSQPEKYNQILQGKSVVGLFEKPSLRTRVSFDVGIHKLGGHFLYLDCQQGKLSGRETWTDTGANLGCWADAIVARVFEHDTLQALSAGTRKPVVNALCDVYHPCQALADYLTLKEVYGDLAQVRLGYFGEGNNVAHSLMIAGAKLGAQVYVITPPGYEPDSNITRRCADVAATSGGKIVVSNELAAAPSLDVLYTDTWISMGSDQELSDIQDVFHPYQLNETLLEQTGASHVMHCQPAHRDVEISAALMDSDASLLLQQAENRMHAQNALLAKLLSKEF